MNPAFHPYVVTGYLTAMATLALGLFVFSKSPRSIVHRSFFVFSLSIAQWSFFTALHAMTLDYAWALFWSKFYHIGGLLIPVFFYYFTQVITGKVRRLPLALGFLGAFILIALNFTTSQFIQGMRSDVGVPHFASAGPFYFLIVLFFLAYVLLAIIHLWKELQISSGARRKHLRYFFIASVIGFGIGVVNFFPFYGITYFPYPYSASCGAIYALVIAYAILREKLFDIELAVKKGLVFGILFGAVYLAVSGFIYFTGYFLARASIPFLSGVSIALAMLLYEPLKAGLTALTNRFLFQKRIAYTELVRALTERLAGTPDLQSLASQMTGFLTSEMALEWAGLYVRAESNAHFKLLSATEETACLELTEEDLPVRLLRERTTPLILSPFDIESDVSPEAKTSLRRDRIEALVPILVEEKLYGILTIGKKKSDDAFSVQDEALLRTLMDEAGMSFLSAKLIKEYVRSSLELAEQRKMAAVKELSGGVHHEVRNPLHAIAQESDTIITDIRNGRYQEIDLKDFASEIIELSWIMIHCAKRAETSLARFARFARPTHDPDLIPIDLAAELKRFLEVMREGQRLDRIKIHNSVEKEVWVLARTGALQEIFFNLFNYAYESMKGRGKLFLSSSVRGEYVELCIRDTGLGILPEMLPYIFESSLSNKTDYEIARIGLTAAKHRAESMGGTLQASSPSRRGTEFILKLKNVNKEPSIPS